MRSRAKTNAICEQILNKGEESGKRSLYAVFLSLSFFFFFFFFFFSACNIFPRLYYSDVLQFSLYCSSLSKRREQTSVGPMCMC